jgi:hypothetical protein
MQCQKGFYILGKKANDSTRSHNPSQSQKPVNAGFREIKSVDEEKGKGEPTSRKIGVQNLEKTRLNVDFPWPASSFSSTCICQGTKDA